MYLNAFRVEEIASQIFMKRNGACAVFFFFFNKIFLGAVLGLQKF